VMYEGEVQLVHEELGVFGTSFAADRTRAARVLERRDTEIAEAAEPKNFLGRSPKKISARLRVSASPRSLWDTPDGECA
jgi:hypothetical protein